MNSKFTIARMRVLSSTTSSIRLAPTRLRRTIRSASPIMLRAVMLRIISE